MNENLIGLNKKEEEILINKHNGNLKPFLQNFKNIFIEKDSVDKIFYIYRSKEEYEKSLKEYSHLYIQKSKDINYINGWLYGMVQGKFNVIEII